MSEIRFENVAKHYGNVRVIDNLDLTINPGEFMVLVGPSGCAKSTTLRMIAGLESITSGNLWIGGEKANNLNPKDRNISMVFQSYALFPNMTVKGNLSFGMKIRKESGSIITKEVERVAKMLGLSDLLDRKPRQLSGGQAQRVALGRAMIRQPLAFLFDEPLSNLDADLRVQMRSEISQMQEDLNITTLYVTHDQIEAMTMGHRVAVMDKGKIMQVGSPIDLYGNPANKFVASFIGSPRMNFTSIKNNRAFGTLLPPAFQAFGNAEMGVRPEHILIIKDTDENKHLTAKGVIRHLEKLGHETLLYLDLDDGSSLTIRMEAEKVMDQKKGASLLFAIPFDRLLFFNRDGGERLT